MKWITPMSWTRYTVDGVDWRCRPDVADWLHASGVLSRAARFEPGEGFELRKEVSLKRLARLIAPRNGSSVRLLVKEYKPRRGVGGLRQRFGRGEAVQEARLAEKIEARGVPCAAPWAVGRAPATGLGRTSFLVTPEVESVPLDRYLRGQESPVGLDQRTRTRLAVCRAVGAFARRVHDAGVFQDDFDPNNILIRVGSGGTPECVLVDYERVRLLPLRMIRKWSTERSDRLFHQRCWSLAKMNRFDAARTTERWAFLRGYIEGEPRLESQRSWFALEILRMHGQVLARDVQKVMGDCRRENRNFHQRREGRWTISERKAWPARFGERFPAPTGAPSASELEAGAAVPGAAMSATEALRRWECESALLRTGFAVIPPLWVAIDRRRNVGLLGHATLSDIWTWREVARRLRGEIGERGGGGISSAMLAKIDAHLLVREAGRLFGRLMRAGCWIEPPGTATWRVQTSSDGGIRLVLARADRFREIRPVLPRSYDHAVEMASERLLKEMEEDLGPVPGLRETFLAASRRVLGRWKGR